MCFWPVHEKACLVIEIRACPSLELGMRSLIRLKFGDLEMNPLQRLPSRKTKQIQ